MAQVRRGGGAQWRRGGSAVRRWPVGLLPSAGVNAPYPLPPSSVPVASGECSVALYCSRRATLASNSCAVGNWPVSYLE